jgi:gliding motility-associated-like protein
VYDLPDAQFTADTVVGCMGLQVQFTNTTDTLVSTCSWTFGDGGTSNQCDPLYTYNTAGLFNVELTVTSPNQCVDSLFQQQYITIRANPAIDFDSDTIAGCLPLEIEFTNLTPFWQVDSVHWDFGNSTTSSESNPTATYDEVGVYDVFFSVVDDLGCESDTSVAHMITVYGPPVVSFTNEPDSGCYPLEVTFTNTTDPANSASCLWTFGDGSTSNICDTPHIYEDAGLFSVTLRVTSPQNCVADTTYTDLITVFDHPTADFDFGPQPTDYFQTEITFLNRSSYDALSWQWSFGEGGVLGTSTEVAPVFTFPDNDAGQYPVQLVVENMHGCTDTIEKVVVIDGYFSVYAPNCFTPDGDGVNDGWRPIIMDQDPRDYQLRVFDRWGEVIWGSTDPNALWDGRAGSDDPKTNVYVWKLETRDAVNNVNKSFIGHVTVIR